MAGLGRTGMSEVHLMGAGGGPSLKGVMVLMVFEDKECGDL